MGRRAGRGLISPLSPNPSYYRQPVRFTAYFTAGLPSGTVTFYDNGRLGTLVLPGAQVLGTAELINSQATLVTDTLAAGTHYILAVYNGDANNNPSTSAPYEQVVEMPTNVIAAEGSVKMGMVFAYSVVASNPNTTPLYSVVITGSIPAQAAYVSVVGGSRVASGGDLASVSAHLLHLLQELLRDGSQVRIGTGQAAGRHTR